MASTESQPEFHPDRSESTSPSASPSPDLDDSSPIPEGVRPLSLKRLHMSEPSDSWRYDAVRKPVSGTSIDTLLAKHERYTKAWKASDAYWELHEFFTDVLLKITTFQIKSCMCLCLGSMTAEWPNVEWSYKGGRDRPCIRSLSQLVAFESWIELLKSKHPIEQMYMQDPAFNDLDTEFLELRGFTVIESPASDDYMSADTFLFTPGGDQVPVVAAIDAAHPALYIGNDFRNHPYITVNPDIFTRTYSPTLQEHYENSLPAAAPLEREALLPFMNQRIMRKMPDSDLATWLGEGMMYYKPASDSELVPVAFEKSDDYLYDAEQAEAYWREQRGLAQGLGAGSAAGKP